MSYNDKSTKNKSAASRRGGVVDWNSKDYMFLGAIAVLAVQIRLQISQPNSVVFDEVHFGGFAKKYILGSYFMDVHPPLAKMLLAVVGLFSGFKGDFGFEKIGDEFPESVPYVAMRLFPALLGVGTLFLCYMTLRTSGCKQIVCLLVSLLLLLENSFITISRFILLDSPLVFFIAATGYLMVKFEYSEPFSLGWYRSLIATGVGLGLSVSSKWVGLFTIVWCGIVCAGQMWFLIGDLKVSSRKLWSHAFLRAAVLLGVPVIIYIVSFKYHFDWLVNEGDGSAFMTSAFRASLNGNTIPTNIEANVGLGSVITIKHSEDRGGYLHSHSHYYPAGSKQQQITLYPHIDGNNNWIIEHYNDTTPDHFVPIHDGMKVRLRHEKTGKRLHSHDEKPPVSERDWQKEASCYGFDGFKGDANDDFVVEIVQKKTKDLASKLNVKALTTIFRLRHAMTGHYLFAGENKLPDWGFEQREVTTASQGARHLTYWYVETNTNTRINETIHELVQYPKLSFWDKFVESHQVMWKVNSELTDHHPYQSDPTEWPILTRGISYWGKSAKNIYLLGNAPVWWATTFTVLSLLVFTGVQILRFQLGYPLIGDFHFNYATAVYLGGWFCHYFPFYLMGRQLFLHHYLPAYYFGLLTLGQVLNGIFTNKKGKYIAYGLFIALMGASTWFYMSYKPLIYGTEWTKGQCDSSKVMKWDYNCNYPNNLNEYGFIKETSSTIIPNINVEDPNAKETPEPVAEAKPVVEKKVEEKKETPKVEDPVEAEVVEEDEPVVPIDEETK